MNGGCNKRAVSPNCGKRIAAPGLKGNMKGGEPNPNAQRQLWGEWVTVDF